MAEHVTPTNNDDIRDLVRDHYADLAQQATGGAQCCAPEEQVAFGAERYSEDDRAELPDAAALASLGCGNPTAVADLHSGEAVLDLGSGGGIDVLLSAKRVGPTGIAYGLDMTDEMLELAHENSQDADVTNVRWLKGFLEAIPLPDGSVDVVISNCVINLSPDKAGVVEEAARVLKPGGRFAVTDVVADNEMTDEIRQDVTQWAACIGGALTSKEYERLLRAAGLTEVTITETHRVHENAGSAIIRARKPAS
jgi:ubiquinone/menaquinone biosynthesis C-methylase UbiE